MAWIHDAVAVHSPLLVITSAEPDSGKTTLLGLLARLTPRPVSGAELTGPSLFRIVDRDHATLIIDEADDIFHRKSDLRHIINASWTRGTKIPRTVQGVTHWFDPFSPKVVGLKGMNVPGPTASRSIVVKLWPRLPEEETIEDFTFTDARISGLRASCCGGPPTRDAAICQRERQISSFAGSLKPIAITGMAAPAKTGPQAPSPLAQTCGGERARWRRYASSSRIATPSLQLRLWSGSPPIRAASGAHSAAAGKSRNGKSLLCCARTTFTRVSCIRQNDRTCPGADIAHRSSPRCSRDSCPLTRTLKHRRQNDRGNVRVFECSGVSIAKSL